MLLSAPAEFLAMARAAGEPMTRRQLAGDVAVYLYIPRPRSRAAWRDFHTLRDLAALGGLPVRFERFLS